MLVQPPNSRVLVFSHSHGGNVMALVTNLLAADERLRQQFFEACSSYYRWPWTTRIHTAAWQNVMAAFADPDRCARLRSVALDIVTFGTPIRYGWDVGGCDHLLHFVNHRPQPNLPPYLAAMPRKFDDVLHAISGDYIQQFGIAGSSLPPTPISWRTAVANRHLRSLLQTNLKSKQLTARFTSGMRVPNDGLTVLVDYQDAGTAFATNLAGHAVYTRRQWMAFHALQIAQRFYGCSR